FSTNLTHLGLFYHDYKRLMEHWKRELNFPMLEVKYEDVVADVEGQTRRMLEYLGLPWEPRCTEFHKSTRHVPTASREQVRRPIYRSSVGRWKRYERHLGPLISALQEPRQLTFTIGNLPTDRVPTAQRTL
ncbi:MAG TPA: sulfotransferase, partial [Tepidisphaeraceae bacterium]|nr:sulfotransferase [Tepidisphaeraceae bacterium]